MMAGRPQKPRARLADRRPGRKTGLVLAFKRPDEPPPEMPAPLNGKWRVETVTLWQAFWTAPIAQVVDRESDMPRLLRWIAYWDEWFRSMRAFRRRRMVEGAVGQTAGNPAAGDLLRRGDAEPGGAERGPGRRGRRWRSVRTAGGLRGPGGGGGGQAGQG